MNIPIIKLEVENMSQTLAVAMTQYTLQLDEMLQDTIKSFCTPDNLRRIVREEAYRQMHDVVQRSVREWFLYSDDGQKLIKEAVARKLREESEFLIK